MERNAIPTSEVLHLTADIIEQRGWAVANGWDWQVDDKKVCLEGGLAAAMGIEIVDYTAKPWGDFHRQNHDTLKACPAYKAVKEYLADEFDSRDWPTDDLWRWNDEVPNRAEEVVEVLRATAAVEYAKEQAYKVDLPYEPTPEIVYTRTAS